MNQIITDAEFKKRIEKSPIGGFLFFGDEDYLKSHSLKTAIATSCPDPSLSVFNLMTVDPMSSDLPEALASALAAAPMMADSKTVVLSGLSIEGMTPKELEALTAAAALINEYDFNLLIISVPAGMIEEGNLPKRPSPALQKLSEALIPVYFPKVEGAKLESWIMRHFNHYGLRAEAGVPAAVIERCGRDMFTLSNEVDKLSFYTLSQGRDAVALADVEPVTCRTEDYDTFALGNAIASGNYERALDVLGLMKAQKVDPVIISAELSKTLGDMLAVKLLLIEKKSFADIAAALKIKSEYAVKYTAQSVKNVSLETLRRAVDACVAADAALKLSPTGYLEIEKLICGLE